MRFRKLKIVGGTEPQITILNSDGSQDIYICSGYRYLMYMWVPYFQESLLIKNKLKTVRRTQDSFHTAAGIVWIVGTTILLDGWKLLTLHSSSASNKNIIFWSRNILV